SPPAVPLAELLDALDRTTAQPVRERIITRHPLQPFDVKNVTPDALVPDVPFTFDPTALAAAQAAAGTRSEPVEFCSAPLPALPPADINLADLLDFFSDPVKGFFRALNYTLPWDIDGIDDAIPVTIDALDVWQVGERTLHDIMRGMQSEVAKEAEWRRGTLPPLKLGWRQAETIATMAAGLADAAVKHQHGDARARDVDIELGNGRRITGTVNRVFDNRIVVVTYSKLPPKYRLSAWISLIALAADSPGREWSAYCIGRNDNGDEVDVCCLAAPPDPLAVLHDLVLIFDAGRREPLPLPLKTSHVWSQKRGQGRRDPGKYATNTWSSKDKKGNDIGDNTLHSHVRVWGRGSPFEVLVRDAPRPGEEMPGEDSRFGALAARLWAPLLRAEGRLR
ncbi:MAG: exodeoxyribonuclease V subunit gamma, partial [Mycobacterium sp.]